MSEELTLAEFPPVPAAEWDAVVRADLKGAAPKAKLFYRAEDLAGLDYLDSTPGTFPYTRGGRASNDWRIRVTESDPASVRGALDAGADEIDFILGDRDIGEVLHALPPCPIHFQAGPRAAELLSVLARSPLPAGSTDFDPLPDPDRAVRLARAVTSSDFRPIAIQAARFAESGAAPVQELAFGLAQGIEILTQFTDRGMTPDEAAASLAFCFSIGSNYFQEIARLRAARTLWAQAVAAFHPSSPAAGRMLLHARTAHWNQTIYDPHVNLLRATTEAMSAAIGGADSISIEPFDAAYRDSAPSARRLARNTQLLLKLESGLHRSVDPAGGAYYLAVLTDSIARDAWKIIQEIEAAGGFLQYSAAGALDAAIAKSRADRDSAAATRRTAIVGTNQYPNQSEHMLAEIQRPDDTPRIAREFEQLRLRTEKHAARTGRTPRFLLLESGDLKMRKARSAFSANFFACAGFEIQTSGKLAGDPDAVVLCSSDAEYPTLAAQVIGELRGMGKSTPVIVAGNPAESIEELKKAGVADFVHIRTNAVESLRAWQEKLGVRA